MNDYLVTTLPSTAPLPFLVNENIPCTKEMPSMFDPIEGFCTEADRVLVRQAAKVCEPCPVRTQCLAYAVRTGQYGVWGGEYVVAGQVQSLDRRRRRVPSLPPAPAATGRPGAAGRAARLEREAPAAPIEQVQALLETAAALPQPRTSPEDATGLVATT